MLTSHGSGCIASEFDHFSVDWPSNTAAAAAAAAVDTATKSDTHEPTGGQEGGRKREKGEKSDYKHIRGYSARIRPKQKEVS